MEDKILIQRSNGRKQWVTKDELEELNEQRKKRDQMKAMKSDKFVQLLLAAIGVAVLLTSLYFNLRIFFS